MDARRAIEAEGGESIELTPSEHAAFAAAVATLRDDAGSSHGAGRFDLLGSENENPVLRSFIRPEKYANKIA